MKLTTMQIAALTDVAAYTDKDFRYHWKPAAMRKLADAGLVWLVNDERGGYRITDAGRKALEEAE